jgi:hypothetical protein
MVDLEVLDILSLIVRKIEECDREDDPDSDHMIWGGLEMTGPSSDISKKTTT